jgi:hypothetical protein
MMEIGVQREPVHSNERDVGAFHGRCEHVST